MSGTGGSDYQVWPHPQCGGPIPCAVWPHDAIALNHLTNHAAVMGTTWSIIIPATILMARLRNKKGWWFTIHQSLAVLSLALVIVGAILGRRLRHTHPPVTVAGKCHKFMGYTATSFITAQALSALLWRPLAGHSLRPSWNSIHHSWARVTFVAGVIAVCLGIHVAGVGWPYFVLHALLVGAFLIPAAVLQPVSKKQSPIQASNGRQTNGHARVEGNAVVEQTSGLIPWLLKRQGNVKQA